MSWWVFSTRWLARRTVAAPLGGGTHGGITAAKNTREPPLVGGLVLILK